MQTLNKKEDIFNFYLNKELELSRRKLEEAKIFFEKDPYEFFQSSIYFMEYAAKLKVCTKVFNFLKPDYESIYEDLGIVYHFCIKETIKLAKYPLRSTSPTQNLMHQLETAAMTEVTDEVKRILEN